MVCPGGREEPTVQSRIQPVGNLAVDFTGWAYFNAWLAGTSMPLVFTIEGPEIEEGFNAFVRVTFPAVKFTGDAADRSLTELTGQSLPWQAFDNRVDPLWTVEVQSTDIAY